MNHRNDLKFSLEAIEIIVVNIFPVLDRDRHHKEIEEIKAKMEFESKKPIEFVIDSAGGYCYHGLALFDRIRQSKCKVNMIATGLVASMGLVVYLAGDYRALTENSRLLNHQSTSDLGGKVSDIKIETQEIFRLEDQISQIIADRTGISLKKIKSQTKVGDDYILPKQALKDGYSHLIIPNKD